MRHEEQFVAFALASNEPLRTLSLRCADDPLVQEVCGRATMLGPPNVPLRLFAALNLLALRGLGANPATDDWRHVRLSIEEHRSWVEQFLVESPVQTNVVDRSWTLLPGFLAAAHLADADTLDLVELGPSAGLNLIWDRYRYAYQRGIWGDERAALVLSGEEVRLPVPGELLECVPLVRSRVGIDLNPIDVRDQDGRRLLEAFLVGSSSEALRRMHLAADILQQERVRLIQGDYVERLPDALHGLPSGALVVVFSSHALEYVSDRSLRRLAAAIHDAARQRDLCWLTLELPRPFSSRDYYRLELRLGRHLERRQILARERGSAALEWVSG